MPYNYLSPIGVAPRADRVDHGPFLLEVTP